MNRKELAPSVPDGYAGWNLSIDEMGPVFNADGTVDIISEHMSETLKEGSVVQLSSNENPKSNGFGKILKINKENHMIRVEMLD